MVRNHFATKYGSNNFFNTGITCIGITCDQFGKADTAVIMQLSRALISPSLRGLGGALQRGPARERADEELYAELGSSHEEGQWDQWIGRAYAARTDVVPASPPRVSWRRSQIRHRVGHRI
jgi:hypothetical protein